MQEEFADYYVVLELSPSAEAETIHLRETGPMPIFELKDFVVGIDAEKNRRLGVLCLLYNRRRVNPEKPSLSLLEFEQLMTIPREHLLFTAWYRKQKQLLTSQGGAGEPQDAT